MTEEINDQREKQKFMITTDDVGIITSGSKVGVNLETIKNEFGLNFNTIKIVNNSTEEISYSLDGRSVSYINGNGGSDLLSWEDGIVFDQVTITNENGVTDTSANEIRISVGRLGPE